MKLKSVGKAIGWTIVVLGCLWGFSSLGLLAKEAVPSRRHELVDNIGTWLIISAIAGWLYFIQLRPWHRPPWLSEKFLARICWTVGIAGFVLHAWFQIDDGCYVDWDGRGNPVVCE